MKIQFIFLSLLFSTFTIRGYSQDSNPISLKTDTLTISGTIVDIRDTMVFGIDRVDLTLVNKDDTTDFSHYNLSQSIDSLLHKEVLATYTIHKTNKEVDMMVNDTSIYFDKKQTVDFRYASKINGVFDIYDYGCAMPGRYSITSPDSSKLWISHYVESKYQTPLEGSHVTVYYTTEVLRMITNLSVVPISSTSPLKDIPDEFFLQTGISKQSVATQKKDFTSGCVRNEKEKSILLNYVKTNKKKNTQVISLTFGGKRLYTKIYHLSFNGEELQIRETEK